MKVGSLVECVKNDGYADQIKLKEVLTVREIVRPGDYIYGLDRKPKRIGCEHGLKFCEFVSSDKFLFDIPFPMKDFRELQPPIANIEDHINENTLEPVYI